MKKQLPLLLAIVPIMNLTVFINGQSDPVVQDLYKYIFNNISFNFLRCYVLLKLILGLMLTAVSIIIPVVYVFTLNKTLKNKLYAFLRYFIVIITLVELPEVTRQINLMPFSQSWKYIIYQSFFLYTAFVVYRVKPDNTTPLINIREYPIVLYTSSGHRFLHFMLDILFLISFTLYWDLSIFFATSLTITGAAVEAAYLAFHYFLFLFLSELLFRRSFSKFFTNSCVAGTTGLPEIHRIFIRTISRLIPLEAFSFLFGGNFHDRFSGTTVVYDGGWQDLCFEDDERQTQQKQ